MIRKESVICLRGSREMHNKLRRLAKEREMTLSAFLHSILLEYLRDN